MTIVPAPISRRFSDNHRCFPQPADRNVHVYRYFNAQRFLQLLMKKTLWFSRSDCLGDPCEGSRPVGDARIYSAAEQAIVAEYGGLYLEQVRGSWKYFDEKIKTRMFISCWQMSEHERTGMWERYCRSKEAGVAIRTTYARLDAAVPVNTFGNRQIGMGLLSYGDFASHDFSSDPSNAYSTFMLKKVEYWDEQEVRLILDMNQGAGFKGIPVPINLEMMIEQVIFSPWMNKSTVMGIETLCRKQGYNFPISQSSLLRVATVY